MTTTAQEMAPEGITTTVTTATIDTATTSAETSDPDQEKREEVHRPKTATRTSIQAESSKMATPRRMAEMMKRTTKYWTLRYQMKKKTKTRSLSADVKSANSSFR